jgi:predicted nuclease of predicted toxin-antitoxin system
MRFLVDECVGSSVVHWLAKSKHDVVSVYEDCRGWDDESILEKAVLEGRILVTLDKDFGDMVFRAKLPHCGIILLRGGYDGPTEKVSLLEKALSMPEENLSGCFVVVTKTTIRVSKSRKG